MTVKFVSTLSYNNISLLVGFAKPTLHIIWPELQIVHQFLPIRFRLQRSYDINYYQAFKLRKILQRQYFVVLWSKHLATQEYHLIQLAGSNWQDFQQKRSKNQPRTTGASFL